MAKAGSRKPKVQSRRSKVEGLRSWFWNSSPIERGQPNCPPAIAGEYQSSRIQLPRRPRTVAIATRESDNASTAHIPQPKMLSSVFLGCVCQPFTIRRDGRSCFGRRNSSVRRSQSPRRWIKPHHRRNSALRLFDCNRAVSQCRGTKRISFQLDFFHLIAMLPTHDIPIRAHRLKKQSRRSHCRIR
jgi:hypothetical protein